MKKIIFSCIALVIATNVFAQSTTITPGNQENRDAQPDIILTSAGGIPQIKGQRSLGTLSAPTDVGTLSSLLQLIGTGYFGGNYFQGSRIRLATTENWTSIARGSNIEFSTTQNGTTTIGEKMRLTGDGYLGIGTINPGFLLNFADILGDKISLWGSSGNHYGFGIQSNLLQVHTDVSGSDVAFGYGTSAAFTETMRVKGNGKVGVGTPDPLSTLNVVGGNWDLATTNGDFAIGNSTYKLKFGVATGGGGAGDARIYTTGGTHRTIFGSNTSDIMTVTPTGVGVGTITPSTGFQIAGTTNNQTELSLIAQNTNLTTLSFNRSTGTLAAPTAILGAYNLGWINFNGYNGTSFQTSSSIRSLTTETWTSTGRGSYLSFLTTNAGTTLMTERIRINDNGNVGIGTSTPDNKLDVLGIIRANEVIVETGWADYVFKDDYQLKPLSEVEAFIKENKHLPSVPSAATIQEKGAHVAELMTKMMEKIEELTLYSIQQKKEIDELKKRLDEKK